MRSRTIYTCEICGSDYERESAARLCESLPVLSPPGQVGDTIYVQQRYEDEPTAVEIVEILPVAAPGAASMSYFHEPDDYPTMPAMIVEFQERGSELFQHTTPCRVNKILQLGKDSYSDRPALCHLRPAPVKGRPHAE